MLSLGVRRQRYLSLPPQQADTGTQICPDPQSIIWSPADLTAQKFWGGKWGYYVGETWRRMQILTPPHPVLCDLETSGPPGKRDSHLGPKAHHIFKHTVKASEIG